MSYRDLRNFTEMMRTLGFPRNISMESFRNPNFTLVAEVLLWLVKRYDPNAGIIESIDTESDRVLFMKSVVHFLAGKAHIKVSPKRLYQADGRAVKELARVASVLYEATKESKVSAFADGGYDSSTKRFDMHTKSGDINKIRDLGKAITEKGVALYDLLGKEIELRKERQDAINTSPDIETISRDIHKAIDNHSKEINKYMKMLENVATDEANLETRIANRRDELERQQKRLKSIRNVRPPYMDEYEVIEKDLQVLYKNYVTKMRNLAYLESQLEDLRLAQQSEIDDFEQREASAKKPILRDRDDLELSSGDEGSLTIHHTLYIDVDSSRNVKSASRSVDRPTAATRKPVNMMYGKNDSDESDSSSDGLIGDDGDQDLTDDDEDDDDDDEDEDDDNLGPEEEDPDDF